MSKFIEKLKNSTRTTPAPMGFLSSMTRTKPKMSLVAGIPSGKNISADDIAGADAVMVIAGETKLESMQLKKLADSAASLPLGVEMKDGLPDTFDEEVEFDFIVFSFDTLLFKSSEQTGIILEVDFSTVEGVLRAIEELPENAVLINEKLTNLTWMSLAQIQRIDNMISKPLLLVISAPIDINGLQMLWGAGVDSIVVDVTQDGPSVKELRELINAADFPMPRKAKKTEVTLPAVSNLSPAQREEEEEEEETEE